MLPVSVMLQHQRMLQSFTCICYYKVSVLVKSIIMFPVPELVIVNVSVPSCVIDVLASKDKESAKSEKSIVLFIYLRRFIV